MKFFLGKNEKNIEKNKTSGNDRLPYFTLYQVPEDKGGKWIQLAAAWRSKSGKGYNVKLAEGVDFIIRGWENKKVEEEKIDENQIPFD